MTVYSSIEGIQFSIPKHVRCVLWYQGTCCALVQIQHVLFFVLKICFGKKVKTNDVFGVGHHLWAIFFNDLVQPFYCSLPFPHSCPLLAVLHLLVINEHFSSWVHQCNVICFISIRVVRIQFQNDKYLHFCFTASLFLILLNGQGSKWMRTSSKFQKCSTR